MTNMYNVISMYGADVSINTLLLCYYHRSYLYVRTTLNLMRTQRTLCAKLVISNALFAWPSCLKDHSNNKFVVFTSGNFELIKRSDNYLSCDLMEI